MKLSAVIVNRNYAKTLVKTLESLNFVDEIIFCDMESTDNSVEIAKKYKAKIFSHQQVGFADPARNFAISKASGDWILMIDSDESVPKTLASEIIRIINSSETADAYAIPRQNWVFGSVMKHTNWWPDYQIRLFKKGKVSWPSKVHAKPIVNGKLENFEANTNLSLIHQAYESIDFYLNRLNSYTSLESKKILDKNFTPSKVLRLFYEDFFRRFFYFEGFKDGMKGMFLSLSQGTYEMISYAKKWEQDGGQENYSDQKNTIKELRQFQKDLNYWLADLEIKKSTGLIQIYWRIRKKYKL